MCSETGKGEGDVGISLDGAAQGVKDAYSARSNPQQALYSVSGLPVGLHTLTLTKESGKYLVVDRFDVR